jgi:phosphoglycolate phosphatase
VRRALAGAYRDGDVAEFRAEYAGVTTPPECVYEGIPETLDILTVGGALLAVCSNKPQQLCVKVLRDTGILRFFRAVVGGDAIAKPKPHPEHLFAAIAALGSSCADSIYIGDSSVDFLASQAAGVPFLLATYGYADPLLLQIDRTAMESIDSPRALAAFLARVRA